MATLILVQIYGILVKKELKQVSLEQALVNAVKPRSSLSLIMFGL